MKTNFEKNADLTELVFIRDRSGSMHGLETDTIGGFNSMLDKQKNAPGDAFVTTYLFDGEIEMLHDREKIANVQSMTERDYTVRGCTALIDAIGTAVRHIEQIHKYARKEDVPGQTVFVIITDGMENASSRFSSNEVKRMVEKHKEGDGWEFLFLGANIDAVETAKHFGIARDRAVNYHADKRGTRLNYEVVGEALCEMRASMPLSANWSKRISEDFEDRK